MQVPIVKVQIKKVEYLVSRVQINGGVQKDVLVYFSQLKYLGAEGAFVDKVL